MTCTTFASRAGRGLRASQRGASLMFALITLVALGLAAAALVRSVDTGALVLGNLGAKKATAIAADRVTQSAIWYLSTQMTEAERAVDHANNGYYANAMADYDVTGFDRLAEADRKLINWDIDGTCAYATAGGVCDDKARPSDMKDVDTAAGLKGNFIITRLCSVSGMAVNDLANNNCATPLKGNNVKDQGKGELTYSAGRAEKNLPTPYYRIIARVKGPRNAVTYTETIVNLASKSI